MPHVFAKPFSLPLPISLAIINQMNTHTRMFFPTFNLEYVSYDHGIIFPLSTLLHGFLTRGYYRPLPLRGIPSLVLNDTYNQQDR